MDSWQETAEQQDGVLARRQALAAGMTAAAWEWKLGTDRWRLALPGVAVAHNGPPSERQLAWAACLHAGEESAVSGDALLRLLGMKGNLGESIDVVIPRRRRAVPGQLFGETAFSVRRTDVPEGRRTWLLGLPVVDQHLALLHAAAWAATDRAAEWRVAAAVQQRIAAVPRLRTALAELPRLPRRRLLRAVLDDVEHGAHAGSELAYLRFCRKHRLPEPDVMQLKVRAGSMRYLDARYLRQRVTLELDGTHHRDAGQWEADALRTLQLAVAMPGERQLRLTMGNLRHDGDEVARLLHQLLA